MWAEKYKDCLTYIDSYWDKVIFKQNSIPSPQGIIQSISKTKNHHILPVPYSYIVPNDKKFNYIFYWDTFFMFKGLMGTRHEWIMIDMLKNFFYLFNEYGLIPNFNSPASLNRSQPPFLTSMILDVYNRKKSREGERDKKIIAIPGSEMLDTSWLKKATDIAKNEYKTVWIDENNNFNHKKLGYELSKYGDRDVGYAHSSELESGWDFTSRFYNHCNYFLPIDLNTYLYKYELDFVHIADITNSSVERNSLNEKAMNRKKDINNLMWNEKTGFYFDYGWYFHKQSEFLSLAGFVPLWAGLATYTQSQRMINMLPKFETEYGLTITAKESLSKTPDLTKVQSFYHASIEELVSPKQWDYPYIWAPLEYLTIIGLLRYGYIKEAKRIMKNSISAHAALFRKYGTFFEKINSTNNTPGGNFNYDNQEGFGWTNAIFYRYIHILDALESTQSIYTQPQPKNPPYEIAILH